jgi:hypothetical protein
VNILIASIAESTNERDPFAAVEVQRLIDVTGGKITVDVDLYNAVIEGVKSLFHEKMFISATFFESLLKTQLIFSNGDYNLLLVPVRICFFRLSYIVHAKIALHTYYRAILISSCPHNPGTPINQIGKSGMLHNTYCTD